MAGINQTLMLSLSMVVIAALIGVVKFKPLKKNDWLSATPNNPQNASLIKSFRSIFSDLYRLPKSQNISKAPNTRVKINPSGSKWSGISPLATV